MTWFENNCLFRSIGRLKAHEDSSNPDEALHQNRHVHHIVIESQKRSCPPGTLPRVDRKVTLPITILVRGSAIVTISLYHANALQSVTKEA